MEIEEFNIMIQQMLDNVNAIIHHQMVIGEIKQELADRRNQPFEQDSIYLDKYGSLPSEPEKRNICGVDFTITILHQEGKQLSDIKGADLLYEIEGEKYILVQYKNADIFGKIKADLSQLQTLLKNCPSICYYKKKPRDDVPYRMNGFCGCFYRVDYKNIKKYLHACEVNQIFGNKNTKPFTEFSVGICKETFEELFATCRLGAMTKTKESKYYINEILKQDHFILHVLQRGIWSSNRNEVI